LRSARESTEIVIMKEVEWWTKREDEHSQCNLSSKKRARNKWNRSAHHYQPCLVNSSNKTQSSHLTNLTLAWQEGCSCWLALFITLLLFLLFGWCWWLSKSIVPSVIQNYLCCVKHIFLIRLSWDCWEKGYTRHINIALKL
jgi:hypothetical protein